MSFIRAVLYQVEGPDVDVGSGDVEGVDGLAVQQIIEDVGEGVSTVVDDVG
jgi:hypothetical protein